MMSRAAQTHLAGRVFETPALGSRYRYNRGLIISTFPGPHYQYVLGLFIITVYG